MLEMIDVHTYYGDSHVLHGISLKVGEASVVGLLGRNGAGKTTTIHSIMNLTPPREGIVRFKGVDIQGIQPYEVARMGVGLVPQGRRIFPSLTVRENISIAERTRNKSRTEGRWDLDKVCSFFPLLKERINTPANRLSGGELQMLAIARALVGNPDLMLMDEPSEGLAPLLVEEIGYIIKQLKTEGGFSILLVEQNFRMAIELVDYVYVISKGSVVYEGKPQELRGNEEVKTRYLAIPKSGSMYST